LALGLKNNLFLVDGTVEQNIIRLINQIYKLLPLREEKADWQKPLSTILEELYGMDTILVNCHNRFFSLLCKLEGLHKLEAEEDFSLYRRTIFECLSLLQEIKETYKNE